MTVQSSTAILLFSCVVALAYGSRLQHLSFIGSGAKASKQAKTAEENATHPDSGEQSGFSVPQAEEEYVGIALNVKYHSLWEQTVSFPARRPFIFSLVIATAKACLADLVAQVIENGKNKSWQFDWLRSMAFLVFGFIHLGFIQWFMFQNILSWLFPRATIFANESSRMMRLDTEGQIELLGQVLIDNFVFAPLINFPMFYMIKELVQGHASVASRFTSGIQRYYGNFLTDNLARMSVYLLADFVIFSAPAYLRMPLIHAVGFCWMIFLSFLRGSIEPPSDKEGVTNTA